MSGSGVCDKAQGYQGQIEIRKGKHYEFAAQLLSM